MTRPPRIMSPVPGTEDLEVRGGRRTRCLRVSGTRDGPRDGPREKETISSAGIDIPRLLRGSASQAELFLFLLLDLQLPKGSKTDREFNAIVLEPTRAENGQFKRLGFFETMSQRCVIAIETATESYELETQFYESFDGVMGYTIEIM